MEVEEAGTGDLDLVHVPGEVSGQLGLQIGRQLARWPVQRLGRGEGDVGGPVAVLSAGRALEVQRAGVGLGPQGGERGRDGVGEGGADGGHGLLNGRRSGGGPKTL